MDVWDIEDMHRLAKQKKGFFSYSPIEIFLIIIYYYYITYF